MKCGQPMAAVGRFLPVMTVRELCSWTTCYAGSTGRVRQQADIATVVFAHLNALKEVRLKASFVTDTATMCVFDVASLKHRLDDDADWWSIPDAELEEVNRGNVAFLNLGSDGKYSFTFAEEVQYPQVEMSLHVPSGRLFVGAAEEITADGLEPEAVRGGIFIDVQPGEYTLRVSRNGTEISLSLHFVHSSKRNEFDSLIRI
jgi:hypothetical protein